MTGESTIKLILEIIILLNFFYLFDLKNFFNKFELDLKLKLNFNGFFFLWSKWIHFRKVWNHILITGARQQRIVINDSNCSNSFFFFICLMIEFTIRNIIVMKETCWKISKFWDRNVQDYVILEEIHIKHWQCYETTTFRMNCLRDCLKSNSSPRKFSISKHMKLDEVHDIQPKRKTSNWTFSPLLGARAGLFFLFFLIFSIWNLFIRYLRGL